MNLPMLTGALIEQILGRLPSVRIGVLGDLFLDRYLDLDASLTEASLETGLGAYQVVRVRCYPGAAGTVINNLAALGVGHIDALAIIGDDGEGYELRQALSALPAVNADRLFTAADRRTPTYTKPMLMEPGMPARELNRLDIKNRTPTPTIAEDRTLAALADVWPHLDALIVLDQVSEPNCGTVTDRVRERLAEMGQANPDKLIVADSRERIGEFRNVTAKVNRGECVRTARGHETESWERAAAGLALLTGRPLVCTAAEQGAFVVRAVGETMTLHPIPAYPITGPIDSVGAGDSFSAGIASAVAAGVTLEQAAAFGNLVASIAVQQLGVTGTASPEQVRARWYEVRS